jgi:hypothetical protein
MSADRFFGRRIRAHHPGLWGAADMTVNFYEDPDDRDHGDDLDGLCELCACAEFDDLDDLDGFDGSDESFEMDRPHDSLTVNFAFDRDGDRLACLYTGGLWQLGIPELYLQPPRSHWSGNPTVDAGLAVFLSTALIRLGSRLLMADGFEVPPYFAGLGNRQVRFWLGGQEPPPERLIRLLDPDVDTVIQVHCSLWHRPLLGDGLPRLRPGGCGA